MRFKLLAAAVLFTAPALVLAKPLTVCTESSPTGPTGAASRATVTA